MEKILKPDLLIMSRLGVTPTINKHLCAQWTLFSPMLLLFRGSWRQDQLLFFLYGVHTILLFGHALLMFAKNCNNYQMRNLLMSSIRHLPRYLIFILALLWIKFFLVSLRIKLFNILLWLKKLMAKELQHLLVWLYQIIMQPIEWLWLEKLLIKYTQWLDRALT